MGWEIGNSDNTERLPVDTRFVAKLERMPEAKAEQVNSRFMKKWRSESEYAKSSGLNPEERMVYNYVADLVASGQVVDPLSIESDLMITSGKFLDKASKFYSTKGKVKEGEIPVEIPAGSYIEGILAKLQQKGLVKYA